MTENTFDAHMDSAPVTPVARTNESCRFMYFGLIVPAYSYAYFAPGIIQTYGYGRIQTQLHSVPPWAAAFGFAMVLATLSDASKHRFAYAIFSICVGIVGFAILISVHDNTNLQYGALFLVTSGVYGAMPIVVCWYVIALRTFPGTSLTAYLPLCRFNMNLGGHHRRSVGSAWQVGFGNIGTSHNFPCVRNKKLMLYSTHTGGIIAVFAFLAKDVSLPHKTPWQDKNQATQASSSCDKPSHTLLTFQPSQKPKYIPGFSICIAFTILSIIACIIYGIACFAENKQRDRAGVDPNLTEEQKTELGDKSPEYRYLL